MLLTNNSKKIIHKNRCKPRPKANDGRVAARIICWAETVLALTMAGFFVTAADGVGATVPPS